VGWGHSCIEHALAFARKAQVANVVLFHHDPYHTDAELEVLLDEAHRQWDGHGGHVCLANEGLTVELDAAGVRLTP
jgi:ribonuclease BN (tRNA processing enzyme)